MTVRITQQLHSLSPVAKMGTMENRPLPKKVASPIARAMAGTVQGDAAQVVLGSRVMDARDYTAQEQANLEYSRLRELRKEELVPLASPYGGTAAMGKQVLIALIIDGAKEEA